MPHLRNNTNWNTINNQQSSVIAPPKASSLYRRLRRLTIVPDTCGTFYCPSSHWTCPFPLRNSSGLMQGYVYLDGDYFDWVNAKPCKELGCTHKLGSPGEIFIPVNASHPRFHHVAPSSVVHLAPHLWSVVRCGRVIHLLKNDASDTIILWFL